jgi:hypothetical protein
MAEMLKRNAVYKRKIGRIDIEWPRGNSFSMRVVFPYSILTSTFVGVIVDRSNVRLAEMAIVKDAAADGVLTCSLPVSVINALPPASSWFLDQIEGADPITKLNGSFTLREKTSI